MVQPTDENKAICVIPARGGSKRIPGKNIKCFFGKPMLQWSIEAALATRCFADIFVSTDCPDIASVAQRCGAHVPFMRPANLADDYTTTSDVIKHTLMGLDGEEGYSIHPGTSVCCLYATAPFVQPDDILKSRLLLVENNFVVPVTSYAFPIQRAMLMAEDGSLSMYSPEHYKTRSQDLRNAWHDTGQYYWATADSWVAGFSFDDESATGYEIPRWRVQDIDTPEDWKQAEMMFETLQRLGTC